MCMSPYGDAACVACRSVDEVDGVFDEVQVINGRVVQNKVNVRLDASMLASSPDGLTIRTVHTYR